MTTTVKKANLKMESKGVAPTPHVSCKFMNQVNRDLRTKRNAKAMKIRMTIDFTSAVLLGVGIAWLIWVL